MASGYIRTSDRCVLSRFVVLLSVVFEVQPSEINQSVFPCFKHTHTAAAAMSHNPSVGLPGQVSLYYDGESVRSAGGLIYDSSHFPVTSCFIQDVATTTEIPTTHSHHMFILLNSRHNDI